MQLEPAFGLKFSKYLLELLRDNVTGFHCVGVPRHGEEKCVQSSPSSFHIRGQPPWRLHQCGPSHDLLASLGRDIKTSLCKVRKIARACASWPHQSLYRPNATVRNVRLQQMPWPSARSKQFVLHKAAQQNKEETKTRIYKEL